MLLALHEKNISVRAVEKVKEAHTKWAELDAETAFDLVPHCKLRKCYDGTLSKLEIATPNVELREMLKAALVQTGAKRLIGQAPEAGLEEALSRTLSSMTDK